MSSVELQLAERLGAGQESVLATVIRLDGRPPSRPGAKVLLDRETVLAGTLGCAEFDSAARAEAAELLAGGVPATRTYRHDLGSIEVYLEPYAQAPTLAVFGDTPVARALLRWAPELGFRTAASASNLVPGAELYAVHTDHDDPGLVLLLETLLALRPKYVGLMGSRRHTGHHLEALRAHGMGEEQIAAIQSPVGIDIGGRTPEEIALSILAGVTAIRRGASAGWMDNSERG